MLHRQIIIQGNVRIATVLAALGQMRALIIVDSQIVYPVMQVMHLAITIRVSAQIAMTLIAAGEMHALIIADTLIV
jgi:hypothetical protein